jgi:transposase
MDMHRDSVQVCRLDVVDTGRRRRWTVEEKRRIVEESLQGHRQASATARRHGITNALLFKWRRLYRDGGLDQMDEPGLLPAVIREERQPTAAMAGGKMEVVLGDDRRVIVGPDVDACALARVVEVLSRR